MSKFTKFFIFTCLAFCFFCKVSDLKALTTTNDLNWQRVESGLSSTSNFENNNKPEFNINQEGEFIYSGGQVLKGSEYRGYYYSDVALTDDFKLSFMVNSEASFTDSNLVYFCLSTEKEAAYITPNKTSLADNSFCFIDHSGRSFFSSLYGSGEGGSGFPYLALRYYNNSRDSYYDVYNQVKANNMYAYKHQTNQNYQVVMQRQKGIAQADIYDSKNQLVYSWKTKVDDNIKFNYLSLVISNRDDGDGYGNSGPNGRIWDINLTKISGEDPDEPQTEEPNELEEKNLIYKSLLPLLGKEKLAYQIGEKIVAINTEDELNKYSQEVNLNQGIIRIGVEIKTNQAVISSKKEAEVNKIKFIKTPSSSAVYQVDEENKKLKKFLSEKAYKRALDIPSEEKTDWSIVKPVSEAEFNSYQSYQKEEISDQEIPAPEKIKEFYQKGKKLIKSNNSNTVYLITDDFKKRPIYNAQVFEDLGFKWKDIQEIPEKDLELVVKEKAIKKVEDLKIIKPVASPIE